MDADGDGDADHLPDVKLKLGFQGGAERWLNGLRCECLLARKWMPGLFPLRCIHMRAVLSSHEPNFQLRPII